MKNKKQWTWRLEEMSEKIEENKFTFLIKRLLLELNMYWKFMCTDENNNENKTNLPSPLTFHSRYSFLNYYKKTKPMTLKFWDFQFFLLTVLWKIKCNFISGLFCIAALSRWEEKNLFCNFMVFKSLQAKMK